MAEARYVTVERGLQHALSLSMIKLLDIKTLKIRSYSLETLQHIVQKSADMDLVNMCQTEMARRILLLNNFKCAKLK